MPTDLVGCRVGVFEERQLKENFHRIRNLAEIQGSLGVSQPQKQRIGRDCIDDSLYNLLSAFFGGK